MDTTRAHMRRSVLEVDVFIEAAKTKVRSFMPIGLGDGFVRDRDAILKSLDAAKDRWAVAVKRARTDHGWPTR